MKNGEDFVTGKLKDPSLVGVHALDKYTVRVELNHPTSFFLDLCALPVMSVVPRQTIEKYGDRWLMARPLPSSGPFELAYWRLNDKVRLEKKSALLGRGEHPVAISLTCCRSVRRHGAQSL